MEIQSRNKKGRSLAIFSVKGYWIGRPIFLAAILVLSIAVSGCGSSVQGTLDEVSKEKANKTPSDRRWVVMYEMGMEVRALVTDQEPYNTSSCKYPSPYATQWNGPQMICGGVRVMETTEKDVSTILTKYKVKEVD